MNYIICLQSVKVYACIFVPLFEMENKQPNQTEQSVQEQSKVIFQKLAPSQTPYA